MNASSRASIALALFCFALLSACVTSRLPAVDVATVGSAAELSSTTFYPQEQFQCGPAALLTVLTSSGIETDMDSMVKQVYVPGRQGSLQVEMLAASRAAGRIPYPIDREFGALVAELRAGRPVLVLQNLGTSWFPRWHYAVVIGFDAKREQLTLRSGVDRRRLTRLRTFLHTWRRGDYWGFVVLPANEVPEQVDTARWLAAVAAFEQAGATDAAKLAWVNAVARWPDSAVARFGLANNNFMQGNWQAAESVYRELLMRQPQLAIARNNLALALLRQRRFVEAEQEAQRALVDLDDNSPMHAELANTLSEIRESSANGQSRSGRPSSTNR